MATREQRHTARWRRSWHRCNSRWRIALWRITLWRILLIWLRQWKMESSATPVEALLSRNKVSHRNHRCAMRTCTNRKVRSGDNSGILHALPYSATSRHACTGVILSFCTGVILSFLGRIEFCPTQCCNDLCREAKIVSPSRLPPRHFEASRFRGFAA